MRPRPIAGLVVAFVLFPLVANTTLEDDRVPPFFKRVLQPAVLVDELTGHVFVAWSGRLVGGGYDIWMARGEPTGSDWAFTSPIRITDTESGDQWAPRMGLLGPDHLFLVWGDQRKHAPNRDSRRADIFGAEVFWSDSGVIVSKNLDIGEEVGLLLPAQPVIAASENEIFVGWAERREEERILRVVRGQRNGELWEFSTFHSDRDEAKRNLQLAWDRSTRTLIAVWIEASNLGERVIMEVFEESGVLLFSGRIDSFEGSRKWGLSVASDGNDSLYVAWSDDRLGPRPGGDGDIFVTVSRRHDDRWIVGDERQIEPPAGSEGAPGWQPSVVALQGRTALLSTLGRFAQGLWGPTLDVTYLSLSVFGMDSPRGSLATSVPLFPPEGVSWSESQGVWAGSVLLLVWPSEESGKSVLLFNTAEMDNDTIRVGDPRPLWR